MAEPQIERVGIAAGYGESVVLDNVSLTIADEGSLSILGPPSGVGKSNPLLTIMGFTSVSKGKVPWRGAGHHHLERGRRRPEDGPGASRPLYRPQPRRRLGIRPGKLRGNHCRRALDILIG